MKTAHFPRLSVAIGLCAASFLAPAADPAANPTTDSNTAKASAIVFMLSGGLAAFAGALLSPVINASPDVGIFPAVKSYIIVVLGGMGSVPGAIIASLLLGVIESLGAGYIGDLTGGFLGSHYQDIFAFAVLILVLLFRPSGIMGERVADRA